MQFATVTILLLLLPLFAVYALARLFLRRRDAQINSFISSTLLDQLVPVRTGSTRQTRLLLSFVSIALLLTAIARPQWGFEWRERSQSGIDIVIAVDVSSSMLATDVSPTRLERARREIIDLLQRLQGDRVGLVSFAGVAFAESPLTLDYAAFQLFLSSLTPDLIPVGGTNIQAALAESVRILSGDSSEDRAKAVVLITDGEEFDGDTKKAFAQLDRQNIRVYVLGIGTKDGAPIPTAAGHKRDSQGNIIISRLRPDVLQELATASGGVYIQSVVSEADTEEIYDQGMRKQLEAKSIEWGSAKRYNEYFQIPLALALLVLSYIWLPWTSFWQKKDSTSSSTGPQPADIQSNSIRAVAALIISVSFSVLTLPDKAEAQTIERLGTKATEAFSDAQFEQAYADFESASVQAPDDLRFRIGKAASLYRQGRFEEALQHFLIAARDSTDSQQKAKQFYNAANSLVQLERYPEAVALYEESLKLQPEDPEAIENLAYVKKLREEQQDSSKDDQKDQQQDKEDSSESQESKDKESKEKDSKNQDSDEKESEQDSSDPKNSQEQDSNNDSKTQQPQESESDSPQEPDQSNESSASDSQEAQDQSSPQQDAKSPDSESSEKESADSASPETKESQQQEDSDQNDSEQESSSPTDQNSAEDSDTEPPPTAAQLSSEELMQLKSVQEQRSAQIRFRAKKAIEQLRQLETTIPEKDW